MATATETETNTAKSFTTAQSDFTSLGTRCGGLLHLPTDARNPPVVVMAHGFGAQRDFRLPAYAERFAAAGMAVLLFDYRNFGTSDGEPRNLVDPFRHLKDWKAALAHVRGLGTIDANRIALWGSSFSGGHVIATAADDGEVAAIVSQVPFVDAISSARMMGLPKLARATFEGWRDVFHMVTLRKPHTIPLVGDPDTFAVMNSPDSKPGYMAIVPKDTEWKNECPARVMLTFGFYRPIKKAHRVKCPALVMPGEQDSLVAIRAVEDTVRNMPQGKLLKMPYGHFDIYNGKEFEEAVATQTEFLRTHLGLD